MADKTLIRTIYLYLFSMLGLILIVIGAVNFINMGLKASVFKQAEIAESRMMEEFPGPVVETQPLEKASRSKEFTAEEKAAIKSFLKSYQERQKKYKSLDYVTVKRQQSASINLSLLLVGIPLFIYHWRIIKREKEQIERIAT